jgi:PAS domain S-box-containing protein
VVELSARAPDAVSLLAAIVESSDDAMFGKTLDGEITSWNWGAERMYGFRADEVIGRNVSLLVPEDRQHEMRAILERLAAGGRIEHYETQRLRKDGSILDVSVAISPIRDGSGVAVGASSVARDITSRLRAEGTARALQEQLHQSQRLESVGQLAGGIAHDFNNLLAGIMNYAALVSDGLTELTHRHDLDADEQARVLAQDVSEIAHIAARAAQLTRQLLIFGRRDVAKPEVLDLNAVVTDLEKLLRRTIGESIALATDLAPDLPRTKVDRGQLEQVIMNLVVNARYAMAEGGGRLRVATASFEADDAYAGRHGIRQGHYVRLIVSDTGPGMSVEVAARAFEPFFTTKAKGEGTGLGLATVYGIATEAGGAVVIHSDPEVGTTIWVDLPVSQDDATDACPSRPWTPLTSAGETVLLVEDEDMVREPASRILKRYGYMMLEASNADDALRIAGEHTGQIALLLTDVVMPGPSGIDLAARLSKFSPGTKVLYMSGNSQDAIVNQAVLQPGVNLIEKPFVAAELLRRIRVVLDTPRVRVPAEGGVM